MKRIVNLVYYSGNINPQNNTYDVVNTATMSANGLLTWSPSKTISLLGRTIPQIGSVLTVEYDVEHVEDTQVLYTLKQRVHMPYFANIANNSNAEMHIIAENKQADGSWLFAWSHSPKAGTGVYIHLASGSEVPATTATVQPIYATRLVPVPNPDFDPAIEGSEPVIFVEQEDPSQVTNIEEVGKIKEGYATEFQFYTLLLMPALAQPLFPAIIRNIYKKLQ